MNQPAAENEYLDDYYMAYFGSDADYYYRKLEQQRNGQRFTFNIGAFFFGFLWLLYRKLYPHALAYLALAVAQSALLTFLAGQYGISQTTVTYLDRGLMLGWGVALGFLGNYFYLRQADAHVRKVMTLRLTPQETVNALAVRGGITYVPHIILVGLMALLMLRMR